MAVFYTFLGAEDAPNYIHTQSGAHRCFLTHKYIESERKIVRKIDECHML